MPGWPRAPCGSRRRPRWAGSARISHGFQHHRRNRPDQHRLGDPAFAVARDIARDLASAGRVADMDGILEIERRGEFGDIGGIGVHLVAVRGLGRAAMAAAVMSDDAIALIKEEQHLVVPIVGAQRPAVMEDDGLARAPVLVEDLGAVLGRDRVHCSLLQSPVGIRPNIPLPCGGRRGWLMSPT